MADQVQDQNLEQTTPDLSQDESSGSSQQSTSGAPVPELVDLDKQERFRFAGREWSREELKNSYMFQSDYTKKTQQLAEQRKAFEQDQQKQQSFKEAYKNDVQMVRSGKYTVEDFKKVYPEHYWHLVENVEQSNAVQGAGRSQLTPEVAELMDFKNQWQEERIQTIEAKIDSTMSKMSQKFPDADPVRVLDIARQWKQRNAAAKDVPDQVWEKIYGAEQKRFEELSDKRQQRMQQAQKQANQQGKDVAAGGGIPGHAPRQFKTIKEASAAMMDANQL